MNCNTEELKNILNNKNIKYKRGSGKDELVDILVSNGYTEYKYCSMTKDMLKVELKRRNLPSSGSKERLIRKLYVDDMGKRIVNLNSVKYVYGPHTVTYLQHPSKEQFLILFGESHGFYSSMCGKLSDRMEISRYLSRLLKKYPNNYFDMYLEFPYSSIENKEKWIKSNVYDYVSSSMSNIKKQFRNCILEYKNCDHNNVRIHMANIRTGMEEEANSKLLGYMYGLIKNKDMRLKANVDDLSIALEEYEFNPDMYVKDRVKVMKLIQKEIDRIHPKFKRYMVNIINDMKPYEFFNQIKRDMIHLVKELRSFTITKKKTYQKSIDYYVNLFNRIGNDITHNKIMDIYTIARMLHKFGDEEYEGQSDHPKNIIFYGGDNHKRVISNFFISLGYKIIHENDTSMKQCVGVLPNVGKHLI